MNEAIVKNWNKVVNVDDDVYVLGDLMLNDNEAAIKLIKQLKGNIHIILGNHDTSSREKLYADCYNVVEVMVAGRLDVKGYHFYLSHYPTITSNLEQESIKKCMINLFGHTHQQTNFYQDMPFMYHVGVDSHNCTPVDLDTVIEDINNKVKECINML